MPNQVIDLGYCMFIVQNIAGTLSTPQQSDVYALDIQSRLVDAMGDGLNWTVGRLFKWNNSSSPYQHAYGIVIYHLDGAGAPTGAEFLLIFPGSNDDGAADVTNIWQSAVKWTDHFLQIGATTGSGVFGIHYHKGGLLGSTYAVDETRQNVAPPTISPRVDADGFMPNFVTRPYPKGGGIGGLYSYDGSGYKSYMWCLVINHEVPFIALYMNWSSNRHIRIAHIAGDIVVPRLPGDIYTEATLAVNVEATFSLTTSTIGALTSAGIKESSSAVLHTSFGPYNQPNADGEYDRDVVTLGNDKGHIDIDIVAIQGWYNSHRYKLFNSAYGLGLKVGPHFVLPWVADMLPAFVGWPTNPQLIHKEAVEVDAVLQDTLRADVGVGVADGDPVPVWTSANGNVWTSTGGPVYRATQASNGLPSVEFTATDYFDEDGSLGLLLQPTTYVFVVDVKNNTGTQHFMDGTISTGIRHNLYKSGSTTSMLGPVNSQMVTPISTGLQLLIAVFNEDRSHLSINGFENGDFAATGKGNVQQLRLGASYYSSGGMNAYLHEFQVWTGIPTTAQKAVILANAQAQWGTP